MVLLKYKRTKAEIIEKYKSTFHYGSIKILLLSFNFAIYIFNLHSTMVLLKYEEMHNIIETQYASTFHYGSIKIVCSSYEVQL